MTWLVGEVFWRVGIYCMIKVQARSKQKLNLTAFKLLAEKEYDFFANNFVGSLTKKALAFAYNFETFTDIIVFNVLTSVIPMIVAFFILAQYSIFISLTLLGWVLIALPILIPLIIRRAKLVAKRHDASSKMTGRLSDAFTNIFTVKAFGKEKVETENYGEYVADYTKRFTNAANYQNVFIESVISPIYVFSNATGMAFALYFYQTLSLPVGSILVVFSYFATVTSVFWSFNHIYRNIESSITESAEFTEMILDKPTITDQPGATDLVVVNGSIVFKDVGFDYPGKSGENKFLENFNLEIKPGEKVGLVGHSGGGKTTITKLLLRFLDVSEGEILIDGQDIKKVTQKSLRESIAYVPQEPLLFHRSLFENIAYGKEGASEEEVIQASKKAHAHEFISTLPDGYETLVGERGIKLSGGQRQRVAIARAILKNAPILLLDEATSALDSESEKFIQAGLKELMKDKVAIVIAHRLSTIKNLDKIIVLQQGKIIESGTHTELVKEKKVYASLWEHQSGGFIEV